MKAVLTFDMPKNCPFCPLSHWNKLDVFTGCDAVGGKRYAVTDEKGYAKLKGRSDWCPLRPLPEYRHPSEYGDSIIQYFKDKGFDECLDEITGNEK